MTGSPRPGRARDLFFGDRLILSRTQLPRLVGTTREMTGRVVRELERDGIIARSGTRRLRLLSPSRLHDEVRRGSNSRG